MTDETKALIEKATRYINSAWLSFPANVRARDTFRAVVDALKKAEEENERLGVLVSQSLWVGRWKKAVVTLVDGRVNTYAPDDEWLRQIEEAESAQLTTKDQEIAAYRGTLEWIKKHAEREGMPPVWRNNDRSRRTD